jgi:hypothetical protein
VTGEERAVWPCVVCRQPNGRRHVERDHVDGVCHQACLRRHQRAHADGATER